ncbi:MAG: ribbon-helix-helix protein, CopG family [Planctomycetota bacterium]|nr:MAG: ribbon-helix-helix protein, CopG family [Planctomycetota bacterium]REJ91034.1 MAG: ribbon-helix-helix protein, CopG family [Planctomycetota bacterium]REK31006.1 MAG: ribbon-helix-helix protein, CopG family [Planctomycetota bacterium]REK36877.1 MAG: ribbon-helix-helix protein, CopG family [Planctomycetota bacterium]
MPQLQISLSDEAVDFIEREAKARGLRTSSELIQELVDREQANSRNELDQMLIDSLDSGPAFPITDEWWEQKRAQAAASMPAATR